MVIPFLCFRVRLSDDGAWRDGRLRFVQGEQAALPARTIIEVMGGARFHDQTPLGVVPAHAELCGLPGCGAAHVCVGRRRLLRLHAEHADGEHGEKCRYDSDSHDIHVRGSLLDTKCYYLWFETFCLMSLAISVRFAMGVPMREKVLPECRCLSACNDKRCGIALVTVGQK